MSSLRHVSWMSSPPNSTLFKPNIAPSSSRPTRKTLPPPPPPPLRSAPSSPPSTTLQPACRTPSRPLSPGRPTTPISSPPHFTLHPLHPPSHLHLHSHRRLNPPAPQPARRVPLPSVAPAPSASPTSPSASRTSALASHGSETICKRRSLHFEHNSMRPKIKPSWSLRRRMGRRRTSSSPFWPRTKRCSLRSRRRK